jgi:predicted nuclease of predicted toxin-antitoxin system
MIILDENLPPTLALSLSKKGWKVRHVGNDFARAGIADADLIRLLMSLSQPTFVTLDKDYDRREVCHARYGIVLLNVDQAQAARYLVRLLRHSRFKTKASRMGRVIRVEAVNLKVLGLDGKRRTIAW